MRVFAIALALALTLALFQYPERDLNPHNRYGHRILSPACLPFHHPGILLISCKYNNSAFTKLPRLLRGMVECPPLQSGCSLKTPTGAPLQPGSFAKTAHRAVF
jgi:hypothetical protein